MLRLVSSLLMALLFTADLVLASVLQQGDMYLDVVTDSCAVLAWLVHSGAVKVLQVTGFRRTRGPTPLLVMTLLSVPNLVFTLMSYCDKKEYLSLTEPLGLGRLVLASARTLLLLIYFLAFVFPCISETEYTLYVNSVDESPLPPESSQLNTGDMVAEDGSGCLSRLFYLWLNPLLRRGQQGKLERSSDVYHLPQKLRTGVVCQYFGQCWKRCRRGTELNNQQDQGPRPVSRSLLNSSSYEEQPLEMDGNVGLLRVLHKAFGLRYYILGILKITVNISSFAGPLLLGSLVNFIEEKGAPVSRGVWCALGLFASTLLSAVLRNIFVFEVSKVALSARASLVSAIYAKSLRVSSCSLAGFTLGEVVNLMSTDTDRVVNFFSSFHELWSLPFQFSVTLYLLYLQVGVAFLGGLCVALVLVPFNKFLASRILSNNKHMLKCKDNRVKVRSIPAFVKVQYYAFSEKSKFFYKVVWLRTEIFAEIRFLFLFCFLKLMTEILFGIRVIKFYNWEPHFTQKVTEHRKQELSHLKAIKYLDALCVYTWAALPVVISILTFVTFVLLGHQLTAAQVETEWCVSCCWEDFRIVAIVQFCPSFSVITS